MSEEIVKDKWMLLWDEFLKLDDKNAGRLMTMVFTRLEMDENEELYKFMKIRIDKLTKK